MALIIFFWKFAGKNFVVCFLVVKQLPVLNYHLKTGAALKGKNLSLYRFFLVGVGGGGQTVLKQT